jgi:mannitol-1-/sugar-/sorbitol-6-phosphatase
VTAPPAQRVTAIVFDLDGVLADSTAAVERAWRRWAGEHGLAAADVLAIAHGRPSRDVVRELAPHLDAAEQARLVDGWEVRDTEGVAALPGALECVALARRGSWAIVTSGGRELATGRLRAVGVPLPEVLVTADDVARGKPDPEPYERAARELGVPAGECLVVEDSPPGIAAARRAGMFVVAVATTHGEPELREADRVLASMEDVAGYLRVVAPVW